MTLAAEELAPCRSSPPREWVDAVTTKDGPDAGWGKPDSHHGQLTVDPAISPGGVLPRQSEDDPDRADRDTRSPRAVRVGPPTPDKVPVPTEQSLGLDEEFAPMPAVAEPTQSGKQRPIAGAQGWAGYLATEHRHFVTEHDDFDRQFVAVTPQASE
jgi:hypothetical protein